MAYVSQELKAELVAEIKKVVPKDWKVTFAVRHHSTFVVTISQVPSYVKEDIVTHNRFGEEVVRSWVEAGGYCQVNHYHLDKNFKGKTLETLQAIVKAALSKHWDDSDIQTDYFHCAYYLDVNFGKWKKPVVFS